MMRTSAIAQKPFSPEKRRLLHVSKDASFSNSYNVRTNSSSINYLTISIQQSILKEESILLKNLLRSFIYEVISTNAE